MDPPNTVFSYSRGLWTDISMNNYVGGLWTPLNVQNYRGGLWTPEAEYSLRRGLWTPNDVYNYVGGPWTPKYCIWLQGRPVDSQILYIAAAKACGLPTVSITM